KRGTAVLVTTHFLEEAEHCHHLGFMVAGQLVANGTPQEIKDSQPGKLLEIRTDNNQSALDTLHKILPRWQASIFGDALHVVAENDQQQREILDKLQQANYGIESQREVPFSLEDAFIGIVERSKHEVAA